MHPARAALRSGAPATSLQCRRALREPRWRQPVLRGGGRGPAGVLHLGNRRRPAEPTQAEDRRARGVRSKSCASTSVASVSPTCLPGPYSMAQYGDDAAALLEAVGWDECMVVGVSFGGMVAQELTLRHPDKVRRLVLACTSAGGAGGASFPLHELLELDPGEQAARRMPLLDTRWDAAWQDANPDTVRLITDGMGQRGWDDPESARGLRLQLEARSHHDTASRLRSISCPTLVCGGRTDGIAPPAQQRVPRFPHPRGPTGALRRRASLLHAGRHGLAGHRRVPLQPRTDRGDCVSALLRSGAGGRAAADGGAARATHSAGAA